MDHGWLRGEGGAAWQANGARKAGVEVCHLIDGELPAVGTPVTAEIDWDRRHALMRTHSALHVLCGVDWRDYGAQVTGGNMAPGGGRMDFAVERMSGALAHAHRSRANA